VDRQTDKTASEDDSDEMHGDVLFGTSTNLGAGPRPPSLIDARRRWVRDTNKISNPSGLLAIVASSIPANLNLRPLAESL